MMMSILSPSAVNPAPSATRWCSDVHSGDEKKTLAHVKQRIVHDDTEEWGAADLNLLTVSRVPIVPFSKADQVLTSLRD
jgi:hypothetical protein